MNYRKIIKAKIHDLPRGEIKIDLVSMTVMVKPERDSFVSTEDVAVRCERLWGESQLLQQYMKPFVQNNFGGIRVKHPWKVTFVSPETKL